MNRRQVLFAIGACVAAPAFGQGPQRYALLYPDLPEPERALFKVIRDGIASTFINSGATFTEHAIGEATSTETLAGMLAADRAEVLIALGRSATTLALTLKSATPLLSGAAELPVPTPGVGGISLVVDPDRFLATLSAVAPRINRVSVVLEPNRFGWLRPALERAARTRGKQMLVHEATSLPEAATHTLNILRYGNPLTDSLWLLEQGHFLTPDTLPRMIEEAWARQFLVFSSVLSHVSEGSLFALYMNPGTLGHRLARLALETRGRAAALVFDEAPSRAINLRTARHLANIVDASSVATFDLTLGEQ